jgi:hypothetical protein
MTKTLILGDEYDEGLRRSLLAVLRQSGAEHLDSDWAVVGSQELETLRVDVAGQIITVEAETYIGLTITGNHVLVDEIARKVGEMQ